LVNARGLTPLRIIAKTLDGHPTLDKGEEREKPPKCSI
jgi:hypothetical protein